jgi:hypothetical protein
MATPAKGVGRGHGGGGTEAAAIKALVGEDGGLIAGHARILAARQLGIAEIPVMVAAAGPRRKSAPTCWPTISWRSPGRVGAAIKTTTQGAAPG